MGRTLDALKQGEVQRPREGLFFEDSLEREPRRETPAADLSEEMPFIEVGPNRSMEGSPQVLQHPAQPAVQPPHSLAARVPIVPAAPVEKPKVSAPAPKIELAQPRPLTLTLEPWPSKTSHGLAPEIIAFHQPEHPLSKQYAELLARMQEGCRSNQTPVLLLTGCRRQVGTTTVLLNLAVAGSKLSHKRIVVVDANLRRPGLAARLGYTAPAGLQDALMGRLALEEAILQTSVTNLHLVPAQNPVASFRLSAEGLHWLLSWLKPRFDLVLLDGPAVDAAEDLALLAPSSDALFLVFPQGENAQSQGQFAQSLTTLGARLRGLLHTHWEI